MDIVDQTLNNLNTYGTITQKDYVRSLNSLPNLTPPEDYLTPFSYQQWILRNTPPVGTELALYKQYLLGWNANRYTKADFETDLKNDFVSLIKSLTLLYDDQDPKSFLKDIDFSNKLEVEQVIPFCVEKLKEICIYLSKKRESLKKKVVRNSMIGTTASLDKVLYNFLLKSYTKYDKSVNITDTRVYDNLPYLSACKDFRLLFEEFYDDSNYFDKDPTHTYVETIPDTAKAFYESKGYTEEMFPFLFNSGFASLCADNPLLYTLDTTLSDGFQISAYADFENRVLTDYYKFKLSQKYIGTNQYNLSGGFYDVNEISIDYPFNQGNNWFYFVSGENASEASTPVVKGIFLSATSLVDDGATGGNDYTTSDKIFVTQDGSVQGAWLRKTETPFQTNQMICHLNVSEPSQFLFPYPDYGLSGEGIDWSGRGLDNSDLTFKTLEKYEQDAILSAYFNTPIDYSTIGIPLNNSTLIEGGATGDKQYQNADRILVRSAHNDSNPDSVYTDDINYAWLYRPETTDILIEKGKNYIHWPLRKFSADTKLFPILSSQCVSTPLSSVTGEQIQASKAGSDIYDSDIVYKLESRYGAPVECAFLSGTPISGTATKYLKSAKGVKQNSLALKIDPNQTVTFIWTDNNTDINTVIPNIQHKADCPYLKAYHHSLRDENPINKTPNVNYENWKLCNCGGIVYSPCGHYGSSPDADNGYCDFIYEDAQYPVPFTRNDWKDSSGFNYLNSENFGWFQLTALSSEMIEPDVGWNKGRFINTSTGANFTLKNGIQYKYVRTGFGYSAEDLQNEFAPYMVINSSLQNSPEPRWMKAIPDLNGTWIKTTSATDMVLNPNDYIVYDHSDTYYYSITASTNNLLTSPGYGSSIWSTYTRVPTGNYVEVIWPDRPNTQTKYLRGQLNKVAWSSDGVNYTYLPANQPYRFLVSQIKTYPVNAVAYLPDNNIKDEEFYPAVNIYGVTPTSYYATVDSVFSNPTIDFSLNAKLSGWDQATNSYNPTASGGRPFWAVASDEYNSTTKLKGVDVYGGGVVLKNGYVPSIQPDPSDIVLNAGTYIEYYAKNPINWIQNVDFIVNEVDNTWCELIPNFSVLSNLSGKFDNLYNYMDLVASATNNPSELYLSMDSSVASPLKINYWATSNFTWSQAYELQEAEGFTNYVPISSNLMVESQYPWANIPNRHFPTIASVPRIENLYSINDCGGYFIPKYLGLSTAYSKTFRDFLNTDNLPISGRGLSAVYRDDSLFSQDEGFSETIQHTPVEILDTDSYWMKSEISNSRNAGTINNPSFHQQFMSYNTEYEDKQMMTVGIRQITDLGDPWGGKTDATWANPDTYPPHFTKQYPLSAWITNNIVSTSGVQMWKNDIYGNTYSLVINNKTVTYDPAPFPWSPGSDISDNNLYGVDQVVYVKSDTPSEYIVIPSGYTFDKWYNPNTQQYLNPGDYFKMGVSDVTLSATYIG